MDLTEEIDSMRFSRCVSASLKSELVDILSTAEYIWAGKNYADSFFYAKLTAGFPHIIPEGRHEAVTCKQERSSL